ncbi:MAG: RNA polymerase sigma factor [Acidimicrobiales bacterium]
MHLSPTAVAASSGGATGTSDRPRPPELIAVDLQSDGVVIDDAPRSFDAFYPSARSSIARALALALGDVDLATEATDEALARAYERWPTVCRLDRPEGWVYRVAMNWALSILRRRRRSDHRLYDPGADTAAVSDPDVHAALADLDVKHRSVIVCRHLLGWSVAETAAALNVREGTVKSRLHRAHRILQSRLHHLRTPEELS